VNWEHVQREVKKQVGNGHPVPTGEFMTIAQFKAVHPSYQTGTSTISDPMVYHWIAKIDQYTNLWIGVDEYEVYPERKAERDIATRGPMNEQKARQILGTTILKDNSLSGSADYFSWSPDCDPREICIDATITLDQLEAIAWWVRNKNKGV